MKYTVNLRFKNPGPAKYLVKSQDVDCLSSAFMRGDDFMRGMDIEEYFVEIVNNETNEVVATFNGENVCSIAKRRKN